MAGAVGVVAGSAAAAAAGAEDSAAAVVPAERLELVEQCLRMACTLGGKVAKCWWNCIR